MPERPLLLFPSPELAAKTSGRPVPPRPLHRPSTSRQGQRLASVFQQLQSSFDARQVAVQANPAGIDPEQVLVIETVGNVENFANAVKRVEGLEWMGEIETDELDPDADFFYEGAPDEQLSGRLYLIFSNQAALRRIAALWERSQREPAESLRPLTKFRDVLVHVRDIRPWGVRDRLIETGVLDAWREDLEHYPNQPIRFEAELWPRTSLIKRRESALEVSRLIQEVGGRVTGQSTIDEIAYHAILAEIPRQAAQEILERIDVPLTKCDQVWFFRPVGQTITEPGVVDREVSEYPNPEEPAPQGDPIVALLDGMPLQNHRLLTGRIQVDDPDDWAPEYPAADRQHGTAMASLIVHGDLNDGTRALSRPIYVRPVMKPVQGLHYRTEHIPADVLLVDHIHRAVRRLFEGDGGEPATAPTVRIVNFSIGDRARQFNQLMSPSPLARLLDWLSFKYQVLFVISAGNHENRLIDTGLSRNDFDSLIPDELERLVVSKLYDDTRHRRLLSPAESVNGITAGAAHCDSSTPVTYDRSIDAFTGVLPSPVSPFGSGYRRAIKPELIVPSGRVHFEEPFQTQGIIKLKPRTRQFAPGNRVAAPGINTGELTKTTFTCGTSNAAALMSRSASLCYDALVEIFQDQAPGTDLASCVVPLIKAMLIHGCSWNEVGARLDAILRTPSNGNQVRNRVSRWLGYGMPDITKALECSAQRASVIGFGRLDDGQAHVYTLPLPPSLGSRREWRKLTVTLAWLSPVASTTQRYRVAQLWFEFEDGKKSRTKLKQKLNVTGTDVDGDATRRGTVQHEVFEGDRAVAITDGDTLRIKVNCRKDAGKLNEQVGYGLLVSMEVAEGVDLPIYDEIRTRIAPAIEIRPQEAR